MTMGDDLRATGATATSALAVLGTGAASAVLGLAPWLARGMRLPLQNLWAQPTTPADMPLALLPLSQYAVATVLALVVTGYGVAGLAVRAMGARRPRRAALAAGAGALAVHLVAAAQSLTTVADGLARRPASALYLAALGALLVGSVLTGLLVLRLVTASSSAAAVVGLSVLALLLGPWCAEVVAPMGSLPGEAASWVLASVVRWVPAVLVGAAIAWGGLGSASRVAAAAAGLLLLWVVPAALTAVTSAVGSRVLLPHPAELVDFGLAVLRAALLQPAVVVPALVVAVVVATAGTALRHVLTGPATA